MPLPPLTRIGDLPLGVHRASLQEVLDRFGAGSRKRAAVAAQIVLEAQQVARVARQLAQGFLTDESAPGSLPQDEPVFLQPP